MLCSKLSAKDSVIINSYLNTYATNPDSKVYNRRQPLNEVLSTWSAAKGEYLYRMFNDNLILEREVEYIESVARIEQKIQNANTYNQPVGKFIRLFHGWVNNLGLNYWSNEYTVLYELCSSTALARESMGKDIHVSQFLPINIDFGDNKKIRIDANTKPIRAIGKLVKMFGLDEKAFEDFRLEHSRILNTKSIKGTLCLSIHPLDYMTLSMNEEKWTSCMNWGEPGGYRGGTIEVMNSVSTIVVYLKSETNNLTWYDGNNSWNSKKWRLLITVTPEAILSIKAYPYHHEEIAKTALQWVRELAEKNLSWFYSDVQTIPACHDFEDKGTGEWFNIDFHEGRMMYCDWSCDTHYGHMTLNPEDPGSSEKNPTRMMIDYCGPMSCMVCGKTNRDYYDESYVICDNCCSFGEDEDCYYCENCGDRVYSDDVYWVNGDAYCCDCVDRVASRCCYCGEYFYYEDLREVYLARTPGRPDVIEDDAINIHEDFCTGRWGTRIRNDFLNIVTLPRKTEDDIYFFNRDDLTKLGLDRLFGLYSDTRIEEYFENTEEI